MKKGKLVMVAAVGGALYLFRNNIRRTVSQITAATKVIQGTEPSTPGSTPTSTTPSTGGMGGGPSTF